MKKNGLLAGSLLPVLGFVFMLASLLLALGLVPTEREMGIVQRIFYFHVPLAWVAFLAFLIVFLGSLLYLWKKEPKWDYLAHASAEIGILFASLVLITGPIWAKAAWGMWWTWDPRLTATLVLWLIYLGYLMVRAYAVEEARGARFAAVVGIVGFIDVPIVGLATTLWRSQHPGLLVFQGGLTPFMLFTLLVCVASFTVLYVCLLMRGVPLKRAEWEIKQLKTERERRS